MTQAVDWLTSVVQQWGPLCLDVSRIAIASQTYLVYFCVMLAYHAVTELVQGRRSLIRPLLMAVAWGLTLELLGQLAVPVLLRPWMPWIVATLCALHCFLVCINTCRSVAQYEPVNAHRAAVAQPRKPNDPVSPVQSRGRDDAILDETLRRMRTQ